jgi:hypothetical protein
MRVPSLAVCCFVLGGALAGWIVSGVVPAGLRGPVLYLDDIRSKPDSVIEVTEARRMFQPRLFADFDLQMDVDLAADTDLDLLVRQVEPRLVGEQLRPFQGRFAALRLTTGSDGPGWRSRDALLFGPRHGGASLAPGVTATVWIEARGRHLTANVAGKPQGSFVADDEYGMITFVAHGGNAVVHRLEIVGRGQPRAWLWSTWTWIGAGALGACLIAAFAARRGFGAPWFVASAVPMPLLAWLVAHRADLDLAYPPPLALAALLAGCLLLPVARLGRGAATVLVAVLAAFALVAADRELRHAPSEVDAVFGPDAGSQPSEAFAQMVRQPSVVTGKGLVSGGLHDVDEPGKHVLLLGGQLLYDRGEPKDHLEVLLARELRAAAAAPVAAPCLPTQDGHTAQQWRLFTTFYTGYRPAVLVLGVPRDEMAIDATTGVARSSPAQVRATIDAARAWCEAHACKLVVFADSHLNDALRTVVRDVAAAGTPTVVAADGSAPIDLARHLAAAIRPLLAP